ncbi:MAG TPA: hypothetical protein VNK95_09180, partial [Caldilineaceae bacterium]|nr:hypothetical protein [Caldilineaceae bacterium]
MSWRLWSWLESGSLPTRLVPLLVILLRLCWLWPWLEMARRWLAPSFPRPLLPLWSLPLLFLAGFLATRLAQERARSLYLARLWVAGSGLAALLLLLWRHFARDAYSLLDGRWLWAIANALTHWQEGLPAPLLASLVAAGIWLRSVLDGRRRMTRDDVWGAFATGFIALALLLLAAELDPRGLPLYAERWLVALVAIGLSALALSSLELARITGRLDAQSQPSLRLDRYWLGSVALVIAGLLATGLALGALVSPETAAQLFGWLATPLRWLGVALGYVFLAFAYVIFLVLTPLIEWLRARMAERLPAETQPMEGFQEQLERLRDQPLADLPPQMVETFRWAGLAAFVLALLVIFALALRYFRSRGEEGVEETRETIFTGAMVQAQLAALWQRWRQRLQPGSGTALSPYLSLAGEQANRAAVRALYQAL